MAESIITVSCTLASSKGSIGKVIASKFDAIIPQNLQRDETRISEKNKN